MPSRDLDDLRADVREMLEAGASLCMIRGVPITVVETGRDMATMTAYWLQGRAPLDDVNAARAAAGLALITDERNQKPVTHCKPGQSKHGHMEQGRIQSLAFDCYPSYFVNIVGFDKLDEYEDDPRWEIMGEAFEEVGFTWGGRWPDRKCDKPHFELR